MNEFENRSTIHYFNFNYIVIHLALWYVWTSATAPLVACKSCLAIRQFLFEQKRKTIQRTMERFVRFCMESRESSSPNEF